MFARAFAGKLGTASFRCGPATAISAELAHPVRLGLLADQSPSAVRGPVLDNGLSAPSMLILCF